MICLQTFGIDISSYSGDIDWNKAAASLNPRFVLARALHMKPLTGDKHSVEALPDGRFHEYWRALEQLKLRKGAYVFCHPWAEPNETVTAFFKVYSPKAGDLLPSLDIEDVWDSSSGVPQADRIKLIDTMV